MCWCDVCRVDGGLHWARAGYIHICGEDEVTDLRCPCLLFVYDILYAAGYNGYCCEKMARVSDVVLSLLMPIGGG